MKSLKKSLVLLVVLSMVLSVVAPVFAFNDTIPEGYEDQVNKIAAMGVITGDDKGNFNAESNITRAEMAVIICKMTGITEEIANANKMTPSKFSDVAVGEWYTGWVNIAVNNGVISGFPDGTFRPSDKLTTNQALTLIVKALGRGAFVDKMGAWPGNYVQDAAKLGITKNMVSTGSELANRGNVAIICYNALTVGTWDVTSTTLDGEVRLSADVSLLGKYFKDFAQNIGTKTNPDYDFKLVENITVAKTPLQDTKIGTQQIVFNYADIEIVDDEFESKPRKDAETSTYYTLANDARSTLVAYVPADVCENVASLYGKKVDVLFGEDNVVALITVVDETVDAGYVTAWDSDEVEIEVNGETYDFDTTEDVYVKVFGKTIYTGKAPKTTLDDLFGTTLGIEKTKTQFNRNVIADLIFNDDGEISTIDLRFSENYTATGKVSVEEKVVKSISSKGAVKDLNGDKIIEDIEKLEETDDPRVIKDDELISLADIEEGNVLTIVKDLSTNKVASIFVSGETVDGSVTSIKNKVIAVDDVAYNKVINLYGDLSGKFEDATTANLDIEKYDDEDVEIYLNFVGEASVIIADTNLESMTLGVIAEDVVEADDVLENVDAEVEYLRIKIFTKDAGRTKSYYVYNEKSNKNIGDASNYDVLKELDKGAVIVYSADANKKILSDEIFVVEAGKEYTIDQKELTAISFVDDDIASENHDRKTATIDGEDYRFSSLVAAYNINDKVEAIKGWDSLCDDNNNFVAVTGTAYALVDGSSIKYLVANIANYATLDDTKYAVLTDVDKNEDDDAIVTLYIDGEEKVFELDGLVADRTNGTVSYTADGVATEISDAETALTNAKNVETSAKAIQTLVALGDEADEAAITAVATTYSEKYTEVDNFLTNNDSITTSLTADSSLDETDVESANADIAALNADIAAIIEEASAAVKDAETAVETAEAKVIVVEVGDFVTYELTDGDISAIALAVDADDFTTNDEADVEAYINGAEISYKAEDIAKLTRDHLKVDTLEEGNVLVYQEVEDKNINDIYLDEDYIVYDLRNIVDDEIEMYTGDFSDLDGEIVVGFAEEANGDVTVLVILK